MTQVAARLRELAAPFDLGDLYEECTQTLSIQGNVLTNLSGSSPGASDGIVSMTLQTRAYGISRKAGVHPGLTPPTITILDAVWGHRIDVMHVEGTVSFDDLCHGFENRDPKPRSVFILRDPGTSLDTGMGFGDIEVFLSEDTSERYVLVENRWYKAD